MTVSTSAVVIGVVCVLWLAASVIRFVGMYKTDSRLQSWRRFDVFGVIPIGAFFSPGTPTTEILLVVRSRSGDGPATSWTTWPDARRRWFHVLWNPGKVDYRVTVDLCRGLLSAARQMHAKDAQESPRLQLTEEYLLLLRFLSEGLARSSQSSSVQFALLSRDLTTGKRRVEVISAAHSVRPSRQLAGGDNG